MHRCRRSVLDSGCSSIIMLHRYNVVTCDMIKQVCST